MTTIHTWAVVTLSRPKQLKQVVQQFESQDSFGKRLCIVENGDAIGACAAAGFVPDLLLTSNAHQSDARNVALRELRKKDAHVSFMDDDDYYGPRYLSEHVSNAVSGRITGKIVHWVRFETIGKLWLFNRTRANQKVAWVSGATIGGFARDIPDFPIVQAGEDMHVCRQVTRRGGIIFDTGLSSYLYIRKGSTKEHTYDIEPRFFAYNHGFVFEEFPDNMDLVDSLNPGIGVKRAWNTV